MMMISMCMCLCPATTACQVSMFKIILPFSFTSLRGLAKRHPSYFTSQTKGKNAFFKNNKKKQQKKNKTISSQNCLRTVMYKLDISSLKWSYKNEISGFVTLLTDSVHLNCLPQFNPKSIQILGICFLLFLANVNNIVLF